MASNKARVTVSEPVPCVNCSNEALYKYNVTDTFSMAYCQYHLPKFLINSNLVSQIFDEPADPAPVAEPVDEEEDAVNP